MVSSSAYLANQRRISEGIQLSEMLLKIFSYLPLSDRKNIRLVCWEWYRAVSHHSILKTEKLVCVREHDKKRIFHFLLKMDYIRPNLEFHGLSVDRMSTHFWKKRGSLIQSLTFVNCKFTAKAAKSVIEHCNMMKELSLQSCSNFFTCDVFDYFTKKMLTRSCLESLRIEDDADISDYIFEQIFRVFTQVKSIALTLVNDRYYDAIHRNVYFEKSGQLSPLYQSKNIFSHSAIYEKLKASSELIQDLEYAEIDKDVSHMHNLNFFAVVSRNANLKLKKINFCPSSFNIPSHFVLNSFFALQDQLEHVVLKKNHFSNHFCNLLLTHCQNLRYLELADSSVHQDGSETAFESIALGQNLLDKILSSKLRTLKLHFDCYFEVLDGVSGVENRTLRCLSVNSSCLFARNTLTFVEAFRSLTCLNLSGCSLDDALMQILLENQVNLETLVLSFNHGITDFGLTGKPLKLEHYMTSKDTFSISRLKRLKILDLKDCVHITAKSLMEMILPDLQYLSLQKCREISYDGFQVLSDNCPYLEFLDVSHTTISPESILKLCRQLNRLNFLDLTFCVVDELSMKIILNCSESLRYLRHTSNMYYFHSFRKQWKTTKTRIRMDVDTDRVKKYFSYSAEQSFTSKIYFPCWRSK